MQRKVRMIHNCSLYIIITKWVEGIPTRPTTDRIVIKFLEENILAKFRCPRKIITNNAQDFKSIAMIDFCHKYYIILGHSTTYYSQGNELFESSNKIFTRIINNILAKNKKAWHSHIKYALWANKINTQRSRGTSPFQLIYGVDCILPIQLAIPIMNLLHDVDEDSNDLTKIIN